jgi:tetratricopeptide (TPR) repeat protein
LGLLILGLVNAPARGADPSPEALIEAGHWKRALPMIQQRLAANSNDAAAVYMLARYKAAAGDGDGALPLAEKACKLQPNNARYHLFLAEICGDNARKANVFSQYGLARRFKKEAETAIALDPNQIDARMDLIQFHLEAPGIVGGDKTKTRILADEISKIDPARGYLALAAISSFEKQNDQLEDLYKKAVEANPKYFQAQMALAGFYGSDSQKKYDLAEKHVREAVKLDPDRVNPRASLAALFALNERWQEMETELAQAEKDIPDNLFPYFRAALVLLTRGKDLQRAELYFRKYLTQEPEPGWPAHANAYWRLGQVLEKQGHKSDAIVAMETAVRLKPDLEPAKKDLKRLK